MKIKRLVGAMVAVVAAASISSAVYAAESVALGKPVYLKTVDAEKNVGDEAVDLKKGEVIALPIDATTSDDKIRSFGAEFKFDTSYLSYGVSTSVLTEDDVNNADLGEALFKDDDDESGIIGAIKNLSKGSALSKETTSGTAGYVWSHSKLITSTTPDAYVIFTVEKDVTTPNASLFTVVSTDVGTTSSIDTTSSTTTEKVNACGAAFKLVFDTSAMDYYLHSLTLKVNGVDKGQIKEYVENGTKVEFPVRLTGTVPETVTITVVAETGTATEVTGSKTIVNEQALTLNPTDYAEF